MSSASVLFSIGTNSSLIGWVLLALAPNWKYTYPATRTIVLASCVNYLVNMAKGSRLPPYLATLKGEAKPGFSSLPAVLTLLRKSNDETLLGAWVHYLAFDLLVGEFITRDAAAHKIPQVLVAPCLYATLMLGPIGFLLYAALRAYYTGNPFFFPTK